MNRAVRNMLAPAASLRLTVLLFVLAMILIFFGTIAQKDVGNWEVVNTYFRSLWLMMPIGYGLKVPFVGGYTIGGIMILNLLAAHIVRFKLSAKRIGIIVTHAGLILLILGEVLTGLFAVEWQMKIEEGETVNFAHDIRSVELAIVDPSPAEHDDVVVVPRGRLVQAARYAGPIHDDRLPFEIEVLKWLPNSAIAELRMAPAHLREMNQATEGFGEIVLAVDQPKVSGVESGQVDHPSAYLRLKQDGETLGTWLVSLNMETISEETRQPVTIGDKTYLIELRFVRDYKPYTITLIDFKHDKFIGTEIPKNFSSEVRLVDPTVGEDRPALIYMNHPLRHRPLNSRGETLYQSGYVGSATTILQVVRNPSWLMPYIACSLITLGLTMHFGVMLTNFVERTRR